MDKDSVLIKLVEEPDLHPASLSKFDRYQVTNRVRYQHGDQDSYKDDYFVERGMIIKKNKLSNPC